MMSVNELIMIVVLSAAVYRVGRFIILDTMFEGTRAQVFGRLAMRQKFIWHKIAELLGCPYCITVWLAAGACIAWRLFVGPFAAPVFAWLAVCTGALLFWRAIDWEPDKDDE
jgi:chromate transport protein ChrA